MQSLLYVGLAVLVVFGFGNSLPVSFNPLNIDNDSETRLIVPPEMTSNYFELLKVKSEKDTNFTKAEKADSTPMNFLRSADDAYKNKSSSAFKSLMSFDGSKQTPIFITIPIYISSGSEGIPIISTSIEKITPSQKASKGVPNGSKKPEEKIRPEPTPSVDENKQEQHKEQTEKLFLNN